MSGLGIQVWTDNDIRCFRNHYVQYGTGNLLLTKDSAYFVYCGFSPQAIIPKYVGFLVRNAGSGTQTAEIGIYTSTQPPRKSALTLTKVEATGSMDSLTSTGMKRNSSAFTTEVDAGSHIWAGFRPSMSGNQPRVLPYGWDGGMGYYQIETSASALTAVASNTPALVSESTINMGPVLQVELD